jgi:galactose mutarotase-like enzyme
MHGEGDIWYEECIELMKEPIYDDFFRIDEGLVHWRGWRIFEENKVFSLTYLADERISYFSEWARMVRLETKRKFLAAEIVTGGFLNSFGTFKTSFRDNKPTDSIRARLQMQNVHTWNKLSQGRSSSL